MNVLYRNCILPAAFIIILTVCAVACSETTEGRWVHHVRQSPVNAIQSIFVDTNDAIWAGTGGTLHAFNGNVWKLYSHDKTQLENHAPFMIDSEDHLYFIDNSELVIREDGAPKHLKDVAIGHPAVGAFSPDGILYIASYHVVRGGLFSYDGETLTKLKEGRIRSLAVDTTGLLWATVLDTDINNMLLKVLRDGIWVDISEEIQALYPVSTKELTVQVAPDGAVWVNNLGKYGVYRNGSWTFYNGGGTPVFLKFDHNGTVWGYGYKKLYVLNNKGEWAESFVMQTGTTNNPNFLAGSPEVGVVTFDGPTVYQYNGTAWDALVCDKDLASDLVSCLIYTPEGDLMCGHGVRGVSFHQSGKKGVSILSGSTWQNYNEHNDVEVKNVYQLKLMPNDTVMAYTDAGYKEYYRNLWYDVDSLYISDQNDMAWDRDETMWIATQRGLIEYHHMDPNVNLYLPFDGDYAVPVYNLRLDEDDVMYMQIGTGTIISYDLAEWVTVITDNGLTRDFAIDSEGTIWGARQSYLAWWDARNHKWAQVVDLDDGQMVFIDHEERIWASGYGNIGYYQDGEWHSIPELSEYSADAIAVAEDGRVAFNLFDRTKENYYGIYEYTFTTGVANKKEKPEAFISARNYPNPFNSSTSITFTLPAPSRVTVAVYSVTGQRVKTLAESIFPAGVSRVVWDGTNETGSTAASGVYLYRIISDNGHAAGKMLYLR